MSIKKLVMPLFVAMPLVLGASLSFGSFCGHGYHCHNGYYGGYRGYYAPGFYGSSDFCRAYNRDGITCGAVGYVDGQTGVPWGFGGVFQCTDGCLKWIGPSE